MLYNNSLVESSRIRMSKITYSEVEHIFVFQVSLYIDLQLLQVLPKPYCIDTHHVNKISPKISTKVHISYIVMFQNVRLQGIVNISKQPKLISVMSTVTKEQ